MFLLEGFLYMDVYNTSLLTDVQYLAPLMAYFSPDHHPDSKVITLDDGIKYICCDKCILVFTLALILYLIE